MNFRELVLKNRSTRAFDPARRISREELEQLVDLARLTPSAVNLQPLKYLLSWQEETNALILAHTAWAGLLKDISLPPEGKGPAGYIVICTDTRIAKNAATDVGIAAQTILLGAAEKGLSGCMIGAIDPKLHDLLGLKEQYRISLIVALGKGAEDIRLTETKGNDTAYYREGDAHYVPKRPLEEILINGGAK
ncbi:MAG: nitroreductase family protein [Eubacteriales bacterium]|nr:nitroreductase family protein [Eubacteriales bacterium]MDY2601044.1 nitroreductase family protein [Eubacteriales bacterium]